MLDNVIERAIRYKHENGNLCDPITKGVKMRARVILTILFSVALIPAAFCWEYTFDTGQWSYFDDDTGANVAVSASDGTLSIDYPDYGFHSVRYVFADKDSTGPVFGSNKELTDGYVSATLSYSGLAPTYAHFFFAGAGQPGDDQIYVTDGTETVGGTMTFWASPNIADSLVVDPQTIEVGFWPCTWSMMNVGPVHDAQRGSGASWADSLASVDAVGLVLGYVGDPGDSQLNIDEFTVTPEPSILLLSGPLAGFLGWRIRRRSKRTAKKA